MECPECRSDKGFSYFATQKTLWRGYWGVDDDYHAILLETSFPETVRCDECGAIVSIDYAHGKSGYVGARTEGMKGMVK